MLTLKLVLLSFLIFVLGSILGHNGIVLPSIALMVSGIAGGVLSPLLALLIEKDM